VFSFFLYLSLGPAVAAVGTQDPPVPPQAPPEKPSKEETFPKWAVHGYFATDFSALYTRPGDARDSMPDRGIAGEFALGGELYFSREITLSAQVCVGCHGFELQKAYGEYRASDAFILRAGRLSVPFGGISDRTSPAQVESSSMPLPYIMGWMVRRNEFNLGIVPSPIVDNGAEFLGNLWLSEGVELGYEVAVTTGLKGTSPDIDWIQTRNFQDNNGEPAGAGRITLSTDPVTLGASGMGGHYDPDHKLAYVLAEADLSLHLERWNLRLEGDYRTTEFLDALGSTRSSRRLGYVIQIDTALSDSWRIFFLQDGLQVRDLLLTALGPQPPPPGSRAPRSSVLRYTGGVVFSARPGLLVKGSVEFWDFSNFADTTVFHVELVFAF
jgi:hypothetical protein